MQAIIIDHEGATPTLRSDVPSPAPAAGEALVRVPASSLNPIDGAIAAGMLKGMVEHVYPITLGRDFAGTVEAVGDGVTFVAAGDDVFGAVPAGWPTVHAGAWAEQIVVNENNLAPRPSSLDVATAGVAAFAPSTAVAAVDAIAPQAGETVLVVGAPGGVGSVSVQLINAAGATVVAPAFPDDESYLRDLGVDELVPRDGDLATAVRERYADGVDALIDLVSFAPGAYDGALKPDARVASTLNAAGEGPGRTNVNASPTQDVLARIADQLAGGSLKLPITATYDFADAPAALAELANHTQGKLAVRVG
jgi:NADPH:quinone reductase-like Zn-dependent oxidoreductase